MSARIGWCRLAVRIGQRCQAPRHAPALPPFALWLVAIDDANGTPELFVACTDCVDLIAADLGTTAEEGAVR